MSMGRGQITLPSFKQASAQLTLRLQTAEKLIDSQWRSACHVLAVPLAWLTWYCDLLMPLRSGSN